MFDLFKIYRIFILPGNRVQVELLFVLVGLKSDIQLLNFLIGVFFFVDQLIQLNLDDEGQLGLRINNDNFHRLLVTARGSKIDPKNYLHD